MRPMVRYSLVMFAGFLSGGAAHAGSWAEALFDGNHKDFGSVPRGPELTHNFRIKNTTGQVVGISGARVSCNICSSVSVGKYQLQPGEETAVAVKMYTGRFTGVKVIHIFITFSQPQFDEVRLWVQANSREDISIAPDQLAFGTVKRGGAPSLSTTISFYGNLASQVVGAETETNYIQAKVEKVEDPKRVSSEVVYKLTAHIREDAPAGKWYTDVWVKTNNAAMPRLRVPLTVEIESALSVSPAAVALGEVKVGDSAERKVIVRGAQPFKIKAIRVADGQLEVKDSAEGAKQVHVLTVRLKAAQAGDLAHTVRVVTDLAEEGEVQFTARGKVVP